MSSRSGAARKRLQQPKPQKSSSFKSTFIKSFTSDAKSPPPPPITSPTPNQAYSHSDTSDVEDFGLAAPSASVLPTSSVNWHVPQVTSVSNPYRLRRPSENAQNNVGATPSSSFQTMPYPSPPESREDIHLRALSPAGSFLVQKSVSSDGSLYDPLLFQTESRSEQSHYGSAPVSMLSVSSSLHSSSSPAQTSTAINYGHHYPSPPPSSNSDPLSPLSLSPASTDHRSLPQLVFSESSSDSTSTRSSDMSSLSSLAVNPPSSVFSSSSSSGSGSPESVRPPSKPGFVYPGSRSLGRPSPGGPKFRFKSKRKGTELDDADEGGYSISGQYQQARSVGLRVSVSGPSSICAPSLRSGNSSSNSSGGSMKSSDSGFVFHTTRSRGHPNSAPLTFTKKKSDYSEAEVGSSAPKFMGISLKRKKNNSLKAQIGTIPESPSGNTAMQDSLETTTPTTEVFSELRLSPGHRDMTPVPKLPPKLGTYPFDPYDSTLLENDKSTYMLLRRLNSNNTPSFIHYGNDPPSSVLDLGCGQAHWILEAAIHWKGYGTRFTGFDLADTMKVIRPLAIKNGVSDNIRFVRGNFLKRPLPFDNESFDLVRMANLTYAISYDKWDFVLGEVRRVLTVGGRLELVDDHIFFPAATPTASSLPKKVSQHLQELEDGDLYDTYAAGLDDEGEASDTATLNANRAGPRSPASRRATLAEAPAPAPNRLPDVDSQFWAEQMDSSRELETLFEHMMNLKFGIHLCPSEFILEMMSQIFGHSREVTTMHLTVAPPESKPAVASTSTAQSSANVHGSTSSSAGVHPAENDDERDPLELSPGLILWPSTLIPMSHTELQMHALKHPRTLLSCKTALSEYAMESFDIETEDDMVMEAVWEYEGFLNSRLNPPLQTAEVVSMRSPISPTSGSDFHLPQNASNSNRNSIYSISSVTSEARSAMWDYDFELRHHFAWPLDNSSDALNAYPSPTSASPEPLGASTPMNGRLRGQSISSTTDTIASDLPSFSSHTQTEVPTEVQTRRESIAPPDYSATDPTHVRTFHIYEAIKMDPELFSPLEPTMSPI